MASYRSLTNEAPWEYKDGPYQQIGGYAIEFDVPGRFVFTTVRGGRHEVPETAPDRAFEMLEALSNGRSSETPASMAWSGAISL